MHAVSHTQFEHTTTGQFLLQEENSKEENSKCTNSKSLKNTTQSGQLPSETRHGALTFCRFLSGVRWMYLRATLVRVVAKAAPMKKSPSIMSLRSGGLKDHHQQGLTF